MRSNTGMIPFMLIRLLAKIEFLNCLLPSAKYRRGMKPIQITGDCGATIEVALNERGAVLIRHSQFQPQTWAELHEYSGGESIPKSGGYVVIEGRTFDLSIKEMAAIYDAAKQPGIKPSKMKPASKTDPYATNKLLEAYLILQNHVKDWTVILQQTAEYHNAALTPSQKESVRLALVCSTRATQRLQQLQRGLTK
jgi:hypothetical protein